MPYTITKSDSTPGPTINDGAKDNSTSLTLIGKNTTGYGIDLNNNFYKLLENFAHDSEPDNPISGQLWYDKSANTLKVYGGNVTVGWKNIGTVTAQSTTPLNPVIGDTWFDTSSTGLLKVYNGTSFIVIGPQDSASTGTNPTLINGLNILSTSGGNVAVLADSTIAENIDGITLTTFQKGLTVEGNVTATRFVGNTFTGTANNTTNVGTVTASQVEEAVAVVVGIQANGVVSSFTDITVSQSILRGANATANVGNIGTTEKPFGNVHAQFYVGQATQAQYADLAERFSADNIYDAGTVVRIGGTEEITQENEDLSTEVLGVISTEPAYLMNSGAGDNDTHPPVVIGGRVPVKVKGKVKKGQRLVSAGDGVSRGALPNEITTFNVIGRSLEDKDTDTISSIMAVIKINI
jgi:hypothetical protein